ncbi:hypothetical protein M409DRAFT_62914 [Zasmidium cellare ATCC 36951]|uniref:SET domain-containing protein n=1 Tax=Zasmidium cellare ATCC 36951 TaxID=1080233 RepID=A0A6A6CYI8_ZASCE|nr:uncharacterized protein M409DRAFT_62914 [Zasmidium cellare ATCC 36951]KAF2172105.1 hypothetical protein M409DRAFT_62914 [Zasmidium cellare ATCC 36951]
MEQYKASIESVDNALNRLNQTLASYRLLSQQNAKAKAEEEARKQQIEQAKQHAPPPPRDLPVPATAPSAQAQAQDPQATARARVGRVQEANARLRQDPYNLPLHLVLSRIYLVMGYPDLAAGTAYKALILSDALDDEAEEYHDEAAESLKATIQQQPLEERIQIIRRAMDAELQNQTPSELDPALDVEITLWMKEHYRLIIYRLLSRSLLLCGCLRSAMTYAERGLEIYTQDAELTEILGLVLEAGDHLPNEPDEDSPMSEWPDNGFVRRERYPWNRHEPNRFEQLDHINQLMLEASDKLEVRTIDLPSLTGLDPKGISTQLGVFAKQDIAPGEQLLCETSLLTANNKLQDALCDACSADLPELGSPEYEKVKACEECEVVFCSEWCYQAAMDSYHPALCDKDVEAIAKDVEPAEAADALYSLLLLRALAMAEHQECHPLELDAVKYIWGDFSPIPAIGQILYTDLDSPHSCTIPRNLPFSFEHNIIRPFHMLEKMDIDIFATAHLYDTWIFNTLYAKFRGTASARLSGLGGRAMRGPEVSAVHPMWCLANHSCDPNVTWDWGGQIQFTARTERVQWRGKGGKMLQKSKAGIKKGEEILNHYCDVDLPVRERREWARGALGGDCMCARSEPGPSFDVPRRKITIGVF